MSAETSSTPSYGDSSSRVGDFLRYPRRVLIEALEKGFSEPYFYTWDDDGSKRLENPFLYIRDGAETSLDSRLEIADGWTRELNATDPRPIILCTRDSMTFQNSSIAGLRNQELPWSKTKTFSDLLTVPLVFQCFAREDVESEELALVTALFFRLFREKHLKSTKLMSMGSPIIGPPVPVSSDQRVDLFATPVSFPVTMSICWRLEYQELENKTDFSIQVTLTK